MGFAFKLDITGNMAGQLAPINKGLAQTDAAATSGVGSGGTSASSWSVARKSSAYAATSGRRGRQRSARPLFLGVSRLPVALFITA